jgi:hypothetical protein
VQVFGGVIIIAGVSLIVQAGILAWGEYREQRPQGATDFVRAVRQLVVTIAESNSASLGCFVLAPSWSWSAAQSRLPVGLSKICDCCCRVMVHAPVCRCPALFGARR